MSHVSVIVLPAGRSTRFGDSSQVHEPKQFLELAPGVRLVDAALRSALAATDSVILVLPPGHSWEGGEVETTVVGGATRLESVAAGLTALRASTEVVVVHGAAHPLAPARMFADLLAAISTGADAAVPILPVRDVVNRTSGSGTSPMKSAVSSR